MDLSTVGKSKSKIGTHWVCPDDDTDSLYAAIPVDNRIEDSPREFVAHLSDISPEWLNAFIAAPRMYAELDAVYKIIQGFTVAMERMGLPDNDAMRTVFDQMLKSIQLTMLAADVGFIEAANLLRAGR